MGSRNPQGEWYACENGHPVAAGSTVCTQCGSQVTSNRVPAPGSDASPWSDTPPGNTEGARTPSLEATARARILLLVAIAASIILTLTAGMVVFLVAERTIVPDPTPTFSASTAQSCEGFVEVEIGTEYQEGPAVFCFTVDDEGVVSIAAKPRGEEAVAIEVVRVDGVFWAAGRGTDGVDLEVVSFFLPGSYVVTVTGEGGEGPGPFTLVTGSGDPETPWNQSDPTLPGLDACGTPEAPWVDPSGGTAEIAFDGGSHACLRLEDAAFVKVGAVAGESNAADLNLAVHSFDDAGRPLFIRSVNDAFGIDPEMSLDLEAGTFLIEVGEWTGAPVGSFALYASVDPEFFRAGEVSAGRTDVRPTDCDSGVIPELRVGRSLVFTDNDPVACLTVPETRRLALRVVSFGEQDLTLEVIGFGADGTPFRFAWVDDDLWASDFDTLDPKLDAVLPAGVYVLAVAEFGGEATRNLMIAVDAVGD